MSASTQGIRIIVGGMVGQFPLGGVQWDYFHYLLALAEMGHDVWYFEDTWVWPWDPSQRSQVDDPTYSIKAINGFFERHAPHLRDRWHYVLLHDKTFGVSAEKFAEVAASADVFLNVSGACMPPENLAEKCLKVFLDTDPGYNQIMLHEKHAWSENIERWCEQVAAHDRHLTYAENLFADDCPLPRLGLDWRMTRCPVTLSNWADVRAYRPAPDAALTTIMSWQYMKGPLTYDGREYFGKEREFEMIMPLPKRTPHRLKVAFGGHTTPFDTLRENGWEAVDALDVALDDATYQRFIAESAGEFSIAKNFYVDGMTGWFSCRTACYLAAGRPAIVQDTAWSRFLPSDAGLLAFSDVAEAMSGISAVMSAWDAHSAAAYEVAREYLAADRIIPPMIEAIFADDGGTAPGPPSL